MNMHRMHDQYQQFVTSISIHNSNYPLWEIRGSSTSSPKMSLLSFLIYAIAVFAREIIDHITSSVCCATCIEPFSFAYATNTMLYIARVGVGNAKLILSK